MLRLFCLALMNSLNVFIDLQVQDVQETHEKVTRATAILGQIRAPEEARYLMLLQTAIHEGRSVNLTIPL